MRNDVVIYSTLVHYTMRDSDVPVVLLQSNCAWEGALTLLSSTAIFQF